jgi:hypothetical protein
LATILRAQVIQALQDQGITDPERVDELLGLVGLQDLQIEGAITFANLEGELLRVQTTIALFEQTLNDAPPELLLKIQDQVLSGDLAGATNTIRNWVASTSSDPATSELGVQALITQFPDLKPLIDKEQETADANPLKLKVEIDQRSLNELQTRQLQGVEGTFYLETLANQDLNGNGVIGRAIGGPVNERTPYMVGERGPELFVPNAAGRIVPTNELGGGQSVNITQNITTGDPILTAAEVIRRQRDAEFLAGV